nr:reverse transcriptase domain-containing protein [Tanacetum cinerariifolium]
MSTRSSARNIFPPLDNPELTIRRRSHIDPTLLNDSKMVAEVNGDLPVPDLRTMEELCHPYLNGRGGPIASISIQATNFGLKNYMIQQVQNSCQFHGLPATVGNTQNVYAVGAYQGISYQPQGNHNVLSYRSDNYLGPQGTLSGNTITNPKEDLKGITTRSGTAYQGPTIPTTTSSPVVERETETTKDMVHPANNRSTKDIQPLVVQTESPILNSQPAISPIIEPIASPVSALKPNLRPSIPYPSKFHDQKLRDKANDQRDKFFQIFKDLNFNISFADALILMPKLSLSDLSPTCMNLVLADRSISRPIRVAEDVFVKVGTFHFPADFVVVDFDADPRVPLILWRSFLKTERDLIDVFKANYNDMTANRIDVIDMACEEYLQEVIGFSDVIASGNPTLYYDLIVSTTSPTLTSFENSDFLLEEVDACLALEDDPTSPEVDQSYVNTEGD